MSERELDGEAQTISKEKTDTTEPRLYKVILLNDDYTTMDFVVAILETIFKKTPTEAVRIMLSVHHCGQGVCGVYPKQIAETKQDMVHKRARAEGYPLKCVIDKA